MRHSFVAARHHGCLADGHKLARLLSISALCCLLSILLAGCLGPETATTNLNGHLLVVGSTALQPLSTAASALFDKMYPQAHIVVQGGGSLFGVKAVTSHKSDIGDSDVYADPAVYPDPNLTDHIVCVIPFTMIVNPDVPITTLTTQQLIDIFSTNKYHNWQQLGGPNLPIVPVVRPATSGTRATFRKYILGGRDENGELLSTDSSLTVRQTVAHTPGAISYLALSVMDSSVKAIAIGGQMATPQNIENGTYAYWGYEHMYTLGDDNPLLSAYLDFMLTPQIQQLAQKMGYIPIANMKLPSAAIHTTKGVAL